MTRIFKFSLFFFESLEFKLNISHFLQGILGCIKGRRVSLISGVSSGKVVRFTILFDLLACRLVVRPNL